MEEQESRCDYESCIQHSFIPRSQLFSIVLGMRLVLLLVLIGGHYLMDIHKILAFLGFTNVLMMKSSSYLQNQWDLRSLEANIFGYEDREG